MSGRSALWPMFMANEPPQIRMPDWDQPEQISGSLFVPIWPHAGETWIDGTPALALQIHGKQNSQSCAQPTCEEIAEFEPRLARAMVDRQSNDNDARRLGLVCRKCATVGNARFLSV